MLVPLDIAIAMAYLDEADSTLGEAPRHQTLPAEIFSHRVVETVKLARRVGLPGDVQRLRHSKLHSESEFKGIDPPFQREVWSPMSEMVAIHPREQIELHSLLGGRKAGITDVTHGGLSRGYGGVPERRALIGRWEERGAPIIHPTVGEGWANRDKSWQILILGAQPIGDPRTHARPYEIVTARVQLQQRSSVRGISAMHGTYDAQVVNALGDVRKQFADGQPALAVVLKLPGRFEQFGCSGKLHARLLSGVGLVVVTVEQRLGIEGVQVGRPPFHEKKNDALGAGWESGLPRSEWS